MPRKETSKSDSTKEPVIRNRRARHDYFIEDTLEVGMKLTGTEVKSIRDGKASLAEGYVRASENPLRLTLHNVHIAEYPPAAEARQHDPTRTRTLLAHKREISKLADATRQKGTTLIPLKMYFVRGIAKLLIGVAHGRRKGDKREDLRKKAAQREIDRAMTRQRR